MYYSLDNSYERRVLLTFLGFLSFIVVLEIVALESFYFVAPSNDISSLAVTNEMYKMAEMGSNRNIDPVISSKDAEKNIAAKGEEKIISLDDQSLLSRKDDAKANGTSLRSLEQILKVAGVTLTDDEKKQLPNVEGVERLYGTRPVILGLEQCEIFQRNVPVGEEFISPAGMFNTGTNLLEQMLRKNCVLPEREAKYGVLPKDKGIKYQVPWGKHSPVSWKYEHTAVGFEGLDQDYFLAALVVKDPFTWMDSMCRHKYAANWNHFNNHCPNLVTINDMEKKRNNGEDVVSLKVHYRDTKITQHTSMVHLWNDYYRDWMETDFPKLVVRFEDLLFHAEEVVTKVCECGRGEIRKGPFQYEISSAKQGKAHLGANGLLTSMMKYATESNRLKSFTNQDLEYARKNINAELMKLFHYSEATF